MVQSSKLTLKTLREQVYDHLRESLNRGDLVPGASVHLAKLSGKLGVSKTPLRFALFQLENEGFVTILPRRGCVVNVLSLEEIRSIYQIIGSLESSVVLAEFRKITAGVIERLRHFNRLARTAVVEDDFDRYYAFNLDFHEQYLELSSNERLKRTVKTLKHRLYDFPRKDRFVKEWELRSTDEHEEFVRLLETGKARDAADYIRDVHWDFDVQRSYVEQYYGPRRRDRRDVSRLQQVHLQPARAERARPGGSGRAEGARPRESGRPPRARSEGSEPSEERGEH